MNVWYDKARVAGGLGSTYKDAYHPFKTYIELRRQFRRREVDTPLCILATNHLMYMLDSWRGEANFTYGIDSNQVIAPFERNKYNDMGGLMSFMWQGIKHVPIYESALPLPTHFQNDESTPKPYLGAAVVTTRDADMKIPMKDLSDGDVHKGTVYLNMNQANTAAVCNAANTTTYMDQTPTTENVPAGTYADVNTTINYLTYVWSPMHLKFAYAPSLYLRGKTDTVIRLLDARFWLTRISIGSVIPDPDFYMVIATRVKS